MTEGKVHLKTEQQPEPPFQRTFPNNIVELPSKGLVYDEGNLLSQGIVEVKDMTAKEENILTTESYIKQGVVIDKF